MGVRVWSKVASSECSLLSFRPAVNNSRLRLVWTSKSMKPLVEYTARFIRWSLPVLLVSRR